MKLTACLMSRWLQQFLPWLQIYWKRKTVCAFSVVWNSFFLPAKSQLLHQIITWTGYSDSARGADNGHCHGLSAGAGNAGVSPHCDSGQLGLKPCQAAADGSRAHRSRNDRPFCPYWQKQLPNSSSVLDILTTVVNICTWPVCATLVQF